MSSLSLTKPADSIGNRAPSVKLSERFPGQLRQLNALAVKQRRGADKECILMFLRYRFERSIDLAAIIGAEYLYLKPDATTGRLDLAECRCGICSIGRIDEHSDALGLGQKLVQ